VIRTKLLGVFEAQRQGEYLNKEKMPGWRQLHGEELHYCPLEQINPTLVLRPSCAPEKAGVNRKGVNKKYSHQK